ncbi:MAG: DUF1573 domain-containing protein [Cytophagales bacterium]|nr:DUF1573 domain-containing protein [Cytophagales bacterium]MDW8385091.1 DUF1573 domain-containing protein [Flammeovirgaceae bacterium]
MKKIALCLLCLFMCKIASSQGGKIEFEKLLHDFGNVKQENGTISTDFVFRNTGKSPLKIIDVKTSCGCTASEWTKEEVPAGGSGIIKVTYDAGNRPGEIDKAISVRTDGEPEYVVLRIIGNVLPRPARPEDTFKEVSGNWRFLRKHIDIGKVKHDSVGIAIYQVYNATNQSFEINPNLSVLPSYLKLSTNKRWLAPKDTALLTLEFYPLKKKDWGFLYEQFQLITNDSTEPIKRLSYSVHVVENFHKTSKKEKQPKVELDKKEHNFGNIKQFQDYKAYFTLKNAGEALLLIRKIQTSCGCTVANPQKTQLLPGESTLIEVTFSSGDRLGLQNKPITIITNDPKNPETTLMIYSFVE